MPAIASIVAKLMILVDAFLENFATVSTYQSASNCTINAISGGLTPCGQETIADWFQGFAFEWTQNISWLVWIGQIY
jgi:hypothetical protein